MNIRKMKFCYHAIVSDHYRRRGDRIQDFLIALATNKNNLQETQETIRIFRGEDY